MGASFSGEERHARRLAKVLDQRRQIHRNALQELADAGQSVWLDAISQGLIDDGTLARYIAELSVTGVTSNPSILHQAIGSGDGYAERIDALVAAGQTDLETIAFGLALGDLTRAADLLRPVYNATRGLDGYVSIEVSPSLVDDSAGTVAAGTETFEEAARPNVMIKVPGTAAGLMAAEELLAGGIPVNVTLLFSPQHYAATANAYLAAMERRVNAGLSSRVASVASVFVSRWDAAVDDHIPADEQGRLGLALMQKTLATYEDVLSGPRFKELRDRGVLPQRVLWASTGTKNPALPDTYYLGRLAAPNTVNTVPEKTLLAYADHGVTCDLMQPDHQSAERCIERVRTAGVDIDALSARLQSEGAASFAAAWHGLLESVRSRIESQRARTTA